MTTGCIANVDIDPGFLKLNVNCTGGILSVRGIGVLENNSTGVIVDDSGLVRSMSGSEVASSVWDANPTQYSDPNTFGSKLVKPKVLVNVNQDIIMEVGDD